MHIPEIPVLQIYLQCIIKDGSNTKKNFYSIFFFAKHIQVQQQGIREIHFHLATQ